MDADIEIAGRIKKIREYRNYTQTHMATKLGISQNTYSKLENGLTGIKTDKLEKIAKILEVSPDNILDGDLKLFDLKKNNQERDKDMIILNQEKLIRMLQEEVDFLRDQNNTLIKAIGKKQKRK